MEDTVDNKVIARLSKFFAPHSAALAAAYPKLGSAVAAWK